jgi:hypothetical protein
MLLGRSQLLASQQIRIAVYLGAQKMLSIKEQLNGFKCQSVLKGELFYALTSGRYYIYCVVHCLAGSEQYIHCCVTQLTSEGTMPEQCDHMAQFSRDVSSLTLVAAGPDDKLEMAGLSSILRFAVRLRGSYCGIL